MVNCSWKNKIPKNIAVNGSNAPKIAVLVEPMSWIAIVIVSKEIIVGNNANPIANSHDVACGKICNFVQNFRFMT